MLYEYKPTKVKNENHTALSTYLKTGNYHPFWNHWMITIVHLREQENVLPAKKNFPEATHEILIVPYTEVKKKIENNVVIEFEGKHLAPLDMAKQIQAESDAQALQVFKEFLKKMISPDSDFRQRNMQLIDSILKESKIQ